MYSVVLQVTEFIIGLLRTAILFLLNRSRGHLRNANSIHHRTMRGVHTHTRA